MSAICVRNLQKTYKNGFQAVKGIDLTVNEGDCYALLGANGAGKTTTIGIITSVTNKTAGKVSIGGFDLETQWDSARALLGVVPQEINLNVFETCWHTMLWQAAYYGMPMRQAKQNAEDLLKQLDLWDKHEVQARMLSGGMKRRLMIARALVHNPKILILDEPTAGVDVEIRKAMWDFLQQRRQQGLTIVLTTHYLEEAENLCNRVAIIQQGEIVQECEMRELLRQLECETLVFELEKSEKTTPILAGFTTRLINAETIEVDIQRGQNLNCVFQQLNKKDISVMSMRNKSNRLEQLFVGMINRNKT